MDNEQLMAYLQSLPPEQQQAAIQQMQQQMQPQNDPKMGLPGFNNEQKIAAGNPAAFEDYEGQAEIIADQQSRADSLRNTAMPQGTQAGGQFVAAHPLSFAAAVGNKWIGAHQGRKAREAKEALSAKKTLTQQDIAQQALMAQQMQKAKEEQRLEMENNRRGNSPMQRMADNQGNQGYT